MTDPHEFSESIEETVTVVLLRQNPANGELIPVEGDIAVDLDASTPPPPELVAQLLDSSVRLTAPSEVPYEIVEAINELPIPVLFAQTPWLRAHRVLTFRGGRAALGSFRMRYSPRLGLLVDELSRTDTRE
ncbi:M23 family metallopeptidase [Sphaerimonospora mesophila]|uniref:M23 family metallopeptidase n=1 Tax=Sphaerimonospora mesophila TaxID=37483 RepID=UPI0006E1ED3A